jgi:hypothetical protein
VAKTEPDRSEEPFDPSFLVSSRTLNWSFRRQRPAPDQKILRYFFTQYSFTQYFFTQYSSHSFSSHSISSHTISLLDNLTVSAHNPSLRSIGGSSMSNLPLLWPARSENAKRFVLVTSAILFALVLSLVFPVSSAAQSSSTVAVPCNQFFTACGPIPEDVPVKFPQAFLAIAGDVALLPTVYSDLHAVSDVFHLENNLLDTGLGTGLGNSGSLFSGHFGTLPNPSTYSANAVGFRENPEGLGDTQYLGNGTDYFLGTGVLSNGGGSKAAAAPKNATLELADGEVAVASSFGISIGHGPAQDPSQNAGQVSSLAFYRAKYASLGGVQLPFNIVGTDPAKGAATTNVPTVIVPINVVFAAGTVSVSLLYNLTEVK